MITNLRGICNRQANVSSSMAALRYFLPINPFGHMVSDTISIRTVLAKAEGGGAQGGLDIFNFTIESIYPLLAHLAAKCWALWKPSASYVWKEECVGLKARMLKSTYILLNHLRQITKTIPSILLYLFREPIIA
jgi:hypothetical protein